MVVQFNKIERIATVGRTCCVGSLTVVRCGGVYRLGCHIRSRFAPQKHWAQWSFNWNRQSAQRLEASTGYMEPFHNSLPAGQYAVLISHNSSVSSNSCFLTSSERYIWMAPNILLYWYPVCQDYSKYDVG